jgi:hypothetical protein
MRIGGSPFLPVGALVALSLGTGLMVSVAADRQGTFDPRARALLDDVRAAYRALDALHVRVRWNARYQGGMAADDFPLPGPDQLELRLQRPNRLFLEASARRDGRTFRYRVVSDGTNLWHWRSATNTYTERPTGSTLAEIAGLLPDDAIGTFDGSTWTADSILEWEMLVRGAEPLSGLGGTGLAITLAAPARLGRTAVDVIRMRTSADAPLSVEIDLSVAADSHLVRGYRLVTRGQHPDTGRDFTVTMEADYQVHDTAPRWTGESFRFAPPRGSRRVGPGGP